MHMYQASHSDNEVKIYAASKKCSFQRAYKNTVVMYQIINAIGRISKGSRKGIFSLRSTSGSCATSTKGKLKVLREHYERLGTESVHDQFDDSW